MILKTHSHESDPMLLSNSHSTLNSFYDVVVIGSGYGGAVAAEKLSRQGLKVCVLERGKEFLSGQFPRSLSQVGRETRIEHKQFQVGDRKALFNWNKGKGLIVLRGIGLGGGSLINAAVAIRPPANFLDEAAWPRSLREYKNSFAQSFERIEKSLGVSTLPSSFKTPQKTQLFKQACQDVGAKFNWAPLAIQFSKKEACNGCGECMAGCNEGAKNSLDRNYLKKAKANGAEIFTEVTVDHLKQNPQGGWNIYVSHVLQKIQARYVVLAAGSLGSTEILLRSKKKGLAVSNQIGHRFSGNNCTFGSISYTGKSPHISAVTKPTQETATGPCITAYTSIHEKNQAPFIIEDGSLPSFLPQIMALGPFLATLEKPSWTKTWKTRSHWERVFADIKTVLSKGKKGTIDESMIFLMAGKDSASGLLEVNEKGQIHSSWASGPEEKTLVHQMNFIRKLAQKWKAVYSNQALWQPKGDIKEKISVHPLGGCRMAESGDDGVVNWKGQVFKGDGDQVYPDLYVWDSSIIPVSLGINPLMTISALSDVLSDVALKSMPSSKRVQKSPTRSAISALKFSEVMQGSINLKSSSEQIPLTLSLQLVEQKDFQFSITGHIMTFEKGESVQHLLKGLAQILSYDSATKELTMDYEMNWTNQAGEPFHLVGKKVVAKKMSQIWSSTTQMPVQIYFKNSNYGTGTVHISSSNVLKMMGSLPKNFTSLQFIGKFSQRIWRNLQ